MASIFDMSIDDIIADKNPWIQADKVTVKHVGEDNKTLNQKFVIVEEGKGDAVRDKIIDSLIKTSKERKIAKPNINKKNNLVTEVQFKKKKDKMLISCESAIITEKELVEFNGKDPVALLMGPEEKK